jgi:hypothetical protein
MRRVILILLFFSIKNVDAQKIDSIFFHLYTDSLKKGFYNYINVDGKMSDGSWLPLDTSHIILTANTGHFLGNDLFIDSSYTSETVKVKAVLRSNPKMWKEMNIHIRKRGFDEPLLSGEELLKNMDQKPKRRSHLFGIF